MWILFALLGALMAAVAVVLSKAGLKDINSSLAFAIESVMILAIAWIAAFWQKEGVELGDIDRKTWLFLISAGTATTLSSLFTFQALKLGDAALVTSIERVSLVFAVAMAAYFLKEELNWKIVVGALLILGGAVMIGFSRSGE